MRKLVFTLFAATSMLFANTAMDVQANTQVSNDTNIETVSEQAAVEQVSTSNASAASGTFRTTVASNVRVDAGVGNKIVTVASKGATVKATHKKKVGNATWYRVSVNGTTGWISGVLLTSSGGSVTQASSSVSTSSVVSTGLSLVGTPYRFGGTTTAGFDCSGFIQYVFGKSGKNVSRTTLTQFAESTTVSSPRAGDLVFFANTYRPGISHVGIYIGNNQFVHSGGARAEVVSLNNSYWGPKFHSFKRFN
ncbi:MAG TPA: NlpC/P60 family protein [Planococcus sp. (in: firmicutes)]|nr:NlpC/P60 family protein [Planococcus sp. (in: firmicutes)]